MSKRKTKASAEEKAHAVSMLKKFCPPGTNVYCILRDLSRSGMQRRISLVVIHEFEVGKPEITQLDGWCNTAFDFRVDDRREGIVIGGCGMDMGWALVDELNAALYGHQVPNDQRLKHRWL